MVKISKKTWRKIGVEVNEKYVEEQLGHANLVAITQRYDPKYRKHRYELIDNPKQQPNRISLHEGIAIGIIKTVKQPRDAVLKEG